MLRRMHEPQETVSRRTWPDFAFNDQQWSEIAKLGAIPPSSVHEGLNYRRMLEVTIGLYQRRKRLRAEGGALLPGEVRKELASIVGHINEARERLRRLEGRQPVGWGMSFEGVEQALHEQQQELELYLRDSKNERPKRPELDVYYLVGVLDGIWMKFHEGEMISSSSKRSNKSRTFVEAVLHIADPDIGPGTVTRAIKRARWRDQHFRLMAHFAAK